jgi:adenylate cyclase class IV
MAKRDTNLEIEHKFVVDASFDRQALMQKVRSLSPNEESHAQVQERYFLTHLTPQVIYRHRYDEKNQDLTYKSYGQSDIEVRREVRIALDLSVGSQVEQVAAFLQPLSIRWQSSLRKELWVFSFADCEIVYYEAKSEHKTVCCVELEAIHPANVDAALATLSSYEKQLGFDASARSRSSLFDLLFADSLATQPSERS